MVLGLNGAGKSTLLRIMAVSTPRSKVKRVRSPALKIGIPCRRSRSSTRTHTVRESVEEAVAEVVNALKGGLGRSLCPKYAEPDADFDKLAAQQGKFEEIIQAHDGHNLNVQLERAADALRLPDWGMRKNR